MKRRFRLARSTDFQRVRRCGKSYAHPLVVLLVAPNDQLKIRVGVVAGRALGSAVRRNRAKRRMRACLTAFISGLNGGWDLVFLARKPMDQAGFTEIGSGMKELLLRAGLLND